MPDSDRNCSISYNSHSSFMLKDLDALVSSFNTFYDYAGKPFARNVPLPDGGYDPQSPQVLSIHMASPLLIEVATLAMDATVGVAALKVAAYLFKHPTELGSFMPDIMAGWRKGQVKIARAELELELAQAQRRAAEVARGGSIFVTNIETLEGALASSTNPASELLNEMLGFGTEYLRQADHESMRPSLPHMPSDLQRSLYRSPATGHFATYSPRAPSVGPPSCRRLGE